MKQTFIDSVKDGAIQGYRDYGILPSLTIAQAILESGWGKSELTTKSNNMFGVKADDSWNGNKVLSPTKEFVKGKWISVQAWFRKYETLDDSMLDHAKFLTKQRYHKVINQTDYKIACEEIWKAGYATDPNYPSKLINIIEQNQLYKYDKIDNSPTIDLDNEFITRNELVSILKLIINKLEN